MCFSDKTLHAFVYLANPKLDNREQNALNDNNKSSLAKAVEEYQVLVNRFTTRYKECVQYVQLIIILGLKIVFNFLWKNFVLDKSY